MPAFTIDADLWHRLWRAARAQGKTPEQAAEIAIRVWVEDSEEADRNRAYFGSQGAVRAIDDFTD